MNYFTAAARVIASGAAWAAVARNFPYLRQGLEQYAADEELKVKIRAISDLTADEVDALQRRGFAPVDVLRSIAIGDVDSDWWRTKLA